MKRAHKSLSRVAATLLVTALLAMLAILPVSAAEFNGGVIDSSDNTEVTSLVFDKTLMLPENVAVPTVDFTFTLAGAQPTAGEKAPTSEMLVQAGDANLTGKASFDGESTVSDPTGGIKTATEQVTINISSLTFTEPGVYKYTLTESAATSDDYTVSDTVRTVYLYVERIEDACVVTGAVLFDGNASAAKTSTVNNLYMLTGDPDDPDTPIVVKNNELMLTKTVTGEMGNKTEKFEFEVTVGTPDSGKTYNTSAGTTLTAGEKATFELADGDSLIIYGLSDGDAYSIVETAANKDGYETTIKVNEVNEETASGEFDANVDDYTVAFTNNRDAVSPTGIMMDVAPYAILVILAAAGFFVFARRRRAD